MQRHRKKRQSSSCESDVNSNEDPDKVTPTRFACPAEPPPAERLRNADRLSRRRRIQKIRDEIKRGVYETEEKLAIAIDRLLDVAGCRRNK